MTQLPQVPGVREGAQLQTWVSWNPTQINNSMQISTAAKACIDGKAKPPGSLGRLEDWGVR